MKIGFFDSGIGGITVLYEALRMLPNEDYIYYADKLNVPYGVKPKDEVKKYIFEAAEFIIDKGVKALVVACNTATSIAIEDLRAKYSIPIIGMEPAVKPAVEKSNDKRVLVTATPLTIKEEKLKNLISRVDNEHIVDLLPLPKLVEFAEKLEFSDEAVLNYLNEKLSKYDLDDYETIVLGCTHFPLYKDMFKKLLPEHFEIIDGNIGTVNYLKSILEKTGLINKGSGKIDFYNSGYSIDDNERLKYDKLFKRLDSIN